MKDLRLLVVDDDLLVHQSLKICIPDQWYMLSCESPSEVPDKQFDAALVDMHLTGNINRAEGVEVIKSLSSKYPHLEIVAMSGNLDRDLMEKCLKAGASRFLAKPLNVDEVVLTLDKIEAHILLKEANLRGNKRSLQWVGDSDVSSNLKKQIAQLKGEDGPILIEGESGTGKEVTAQLIYEQEDPGRPFVAINVAAIPENLFESEFFGHIKGAFTGAEQNKMGLAEAASGGDLFLDEIEALAPAHQAKLLRFLETGEVRRVGGKETSHVHVRVIAATNRNLNEMCSKGEFREDLLWRLNGKKIQLPPLCERKDDIKDLAVYFLSKDALRKKVLDDDALEAFFNYSWPGNIRELKRICAQLCLLAPLPIIRSADVMALLRPQSHDLGGLNKIDYSQGLSKIVDAYEAKVITHCLKDLGDIDEAAKVLNISRSSLYKKVKDYGIEWKG